MARQYNNYSDIIDFTRASSGTALTKVSYGEELVTNGTFDSDSDWSLFGGATISGGVLTVVSDGSGAGASRNILTVGKVYKISVDVVVRSGTCKVQLGSASQTPFIISSSGSYTFARECDGTDGIFFLVRNSACDVDFDNVSVREVTFGTGALTLFNHPNNIPRIEYDADGNLLGLLVEESRTNLVAYSDFSSGWDKSALTVTANFASSPDGQTNGAEVDLLTTGGFFYDTISVTAGTVYTWSWYAKAGTATAWILAVYDETNAAFVTRQQYTLTDGDSVGDGWYRHSYTFTAPAGCSSARVYPIRGLDASGGIAGTVGTTYLYNAQVEAGSFPTSAIPTSGSTATRSADVASLSTGAFGYRQDEGSVIIDYRYLALDNNQRGFELESDVSNWMLHYQNAGNVRWYVYESGSAQALLLAQASVEANTQYKFAGAYKENDFATVQNGGTVATDTSGAVPFTDTLRIGNNYAGGNQLNGHIKSIKYYPRRLTNAQLQELTS